VGMDQVPLSGEASPAIRSRQLMIAFGDPSIRCSRMRQVCFAYQHSRPYRMQETE
jgi:hypothetical protein